MKSKIIFFVVIVFSFNFSYCQLKIDELSNFPIGKTFNESKGYVKQMFPGKRPEISKADFLGAYRIEYGSIDFDFYGKGDYTFQFVKDTLVAIKIEFTFVADDSLKFKRLITTLFQDISESGTHTLLKDYSIINLRDAYAYVVKNSRKTPKKEDRNYLPIKTKFLGQSFYGIYKNENYSGKFLQIQLSLSESHEFKSEGFQTYEYDGSKSNITIELTSEKLQDLKQKEESLEISSYRTIVD